MNRRSFLDSILKASVSAMILPAAVTYERKWSKVESGVWVPDNEIFDCPDYVGKWEFKFKAGGKFDFRWIG